ncbi:MAG: MBL fold metallo-hydrolase [Deltaproteobacteria bacterium]|nr:MBL fold metallo-hydrolase [Deltaproteobacteria bacterium]
MFERPHLEITMLGGASDIGASATLVRVGETRLLVDCGVRFDPARPLPNLEALSDDRLDAILVTHAHTDHTGALPVAADLFPVVPVYATPPTIELTSILLRDALKIMRLEDREGEVPLYSEKQIDHLTNAFVPFHFGASRRIGEVEVTYLPASHILGAAMIHLATPAGNVLITGDYSTASQRTVPGLTRPTLPVDLLITEATYGDRIHDDRSSAEQTFVAAAREVVENGGRLLIPAFAIGRAQEVLQILRAEIRAGRFPTVPVFVDGMVRAVCGVYGRHERYVSRALLHEIRRTGHPFYSDDIKPVASPSDRQAALEAGPCVIVASSGMLSGGASVFYAEKLAGNAKDAIFVTGYQDEESPGRALLDLTEKSDDEDRSLKLGGGEVQVCCRVEKYGLSAHADRMQMAGFVEWLRPRAVALVHGSKAARESLARAISCSDVIIGEDRARIERQYKPRKSFPVAKPELDFETARRLLGPSTGKPLRVRGVAEAWFGGDVRAAQIQEIANRFEELGVARRDDDRRGMLWVAKPGETEALKVEGVEEEEIKKENPKGRLLELCMQHSIESPEFELSIEGPHHVATVKLEAYEEHLVGGPAEASTKKVAQQLAAREILESLSKLIENQAPSIASISKVDANPRGLLNELRQKGILKEFRYESRGTSGPSHQPVFSFVAWAEDEHGDEYESKTVESQSKKKGQSEAATDLVRILREARVIV